VSHEFTKSVQRILSLFRGGLAGVRHVRSSVLADARASIRGETCHKHNTATRYAVATTSDYYQRIHQTNDAYKSNNWLLSEIDSILSVSPKSLLEVGCGNGRFLAAVKGRVERVIGVDWARSPILDELGVSADFELRDITIDELPRADLVCSADVLEHIAPHLLLETVQRLDRAGHEQFHVIACYDDGHSHLSIMGPQAWLGLFQSVSQRYLLIDVRPRRDDPTQMICVIATFQPKQ
jgi:SAM-dependent methyltransferase